LGSKVESGEEVSEMVEEGETIILAPPQSSDMI